MRYYETIYIVDSNLENTLVEKTMDQIKNELIKTKASIINHREWGKKRLAYQIANQKYGSFIILQFEIQDLEKMKDFETWLKLNNSVLRHMTVALKEKPDKYVEKSVESPIAKNEASNGSGDVADNTSTEVEEKATKAENTSDVELSESSKEDE